MFEVNTELLKNIPLNFMIKYSLEESETVLAFKLVAMQPGASAEPKKCNSLSKCAVVVRYTNGRIRLTDNSGMMYSMMGFLPTIIRDFARYHGIQGFIFIQSIESLSLYINTAVNFEFIIPSNLIAKKYPSICVIANTSLVNVLTFTAAYDTLTDIVCSPRVDVKDYHDFPIATISLVKQKNRIELSTQLQDASETVRSIILDIQHLITKYNDVNVSSIISLVKDNTSAMDDPYIVTEDNSFIIPITELKDIKLKKE